MEDVLMWMHDYQDYIASGAVTTLLVLIGILTYLRGKKTMHRTKLRDVPVDLAISDEIGNAVERLYCCGAITLRRRNKLYKQIAHACGLPDMLPRIHARTKKIKRGKEVGEKGTSKVNWLVSEISTRLGTGQNAPVPVPLPDLGTTPKPRRRPTIKMNTL